MDAEVPPFHRKVTRSDARIDRWNVGTMHIPGIFFLESGFAPAGSGIERGDISQARQYRNCQFFTPETAKTTHFFWNYLHNWNIDDPTIALSLHDSMVEGFHEDKAIIEQQQRTFDADPTLPHAPDRGRRAAGAFPPRAGAVDRAGGHSAAAAARRQRRIGADPCAAKPTSPTASRSRSSRGSRGRRVGRARRADRTGLPSTPRRCSMRPSSSCASISARSSKVARRRRDLPLHRVARLRGRADPAALWREAELAVVERAHAAIGATVRAARPQAAAVGAAQPKRPSARRRRRD